MSFTEGIIDYPFIFFYLLNINKQSNTNVPVSAQWLLVFVDARALLPGRTSSLILFTSVWIMNLLCTMCTGIYHAIPVDEAPAKSARASRCHPINKPIIILFQFLVFHLKMIL